MIQVRKTIEEEKELLINCEIVPGEDIKIVGKDDYWVYILESDLSLEIMKNEKIEDISKEISRLSLYYPLKFWDLIESIEINRDYHDCNVIFFEYKFEWDFEKWKKPFSILEFANAVSQVAKEYDSCGIKWILEDEDAVSNGCVLRYSDWYSTDLIYDVYNKSIGFIKEIANRVTVLLLMKTENTLTRLFDFPEEVKVPCEQYLLYFVQFLKDIGIDSKASLNEDAGRVLFTVTPTSSEVALEKIHKALDIYLRLPMVLDNSQFSGIQGNPREQQLIANVQHLNTQLLLERAIAQSNQITIQNQHWLIDQQQKFIDATILQQSQVDIESRKNEDILGGTVTLTEYECNGFKINVPNIYRKIKDYLGIE